MSQTDSRTFIDKNLETLSLAGQSIWLDNLSRDLISTGDLQKLCNNGVRGITTNPTIFRDAIAASSLYDAPIRDLAKSSFTDEEITEQLMVEDVKSAAKLFLPLFQETSGGDGFVSIEVSPELAFDTKGTIEAGRRLWRSLGMPNVMIKVPGTEAGLVAIKELLIEGINVNVTLLFSKTRYEEVALCYRDAIAERIRRNPSCPSVYSVASFFVSRLDSSIERCFSDKSSPTPPGLLGLIGIANCRAAYQVFEEVFFPNGEIIPVCRTIKELQRPLWASTSVKNKELSPLHYVRALVVRHTVNTVPPATLNALMGDGALGDITSLDESCDLDQATELMRELEREGVSLERLTADLEEDGVKKFRDAYKDLCFAVGQKRNSFR
jgi:transaldolase